MAATPPLQVLGSPTTPLTPLHGAAYERKPTRQSSRIRQRAPAAAARTTPEASTTKPRQRQSPQTQTPRKSKTSSANSAHPHSTPQSIPRGGSHRIHVVPPSPDAELAASPPPKPANKAARAASRSKFLLPSTTTMSEGMLPTPVKTPSKKKSAAAAHTAAAAAAGGGGRVLFQDKLEQDDEQPVTVTAPSPRRARKNLRYNGFSLESFDGVAEHDGKDGSAGGGIQIFTDNRDRIPEPDTADQSNPFVDQAKSLPKSGAKAASSTGAPVVTPSRRARKSATSGKRTRATREKQPDPQVEEAIRKDEGMVYVFRGKKVYRRFDDSHEEEEVIDDEDLGLLEHLGQGGDGATRAKPLKTLTRKSIKPTRLFQEEVQRRARERAQEEEAPTDIEQDVPADDDEEDEAAEEDEADVEVDKVDAVTSKRRSAKSKSSPFDAWPRLKPGTRSVSAAAAAAAAKKRSAETSELGDAAAPSAKHRKTRASAAA